MLKTIFFIFSSTLSGNGIRMKISKKKYFCCLFFIIIILLATNNRPKCNLVSATITKPSTNYSY